MTWDSRLYVIDSVSLISSRQCDDPVEANIEDVSLIFQGLSCDATIDFINVNIINKPLFWLLRRQCLKMRLMLALGDCSLNLLEMWVILDPGIMFMNYLDKHEICLTN